MSSDYCPSRHRTVRRLTRVVNVGGVAVGGLNPIRLQSMTTSDTEDIAATLAGVVSPDNPEELVRLLHEEGVAVQLRRHAQVPAQELQNRVVGDVGHQAHDGEFAGADGKAAQCHGGFHLGDGAFTG